MCLWDVLSERRSAAGVRRKWLGLAGSACIAHQCQGIFTAETANWKPTSILGEVIPEQSIRQTQKLSVITLITSSVIMIIIIIIILLLLLVQLIIIHQTQKLSHGHHMDYFFNHNHHYHDTGTPATNNPQNA